MAKKEIKKGNYDPRGEKLGEDFMKRMPSYPYLIEYSKDEKNGLDVQLRGKYINIYYQGGNLIKLSGLQTCEFDENYFYLPEKDGLPMTDIERLCHKDYVNKAKKSKILKHKTKEELDELRKKAFETKGYIKGRRDELVNILKSCDNLERVRLVVEEMKKTMLKWKKRLVDNKRRKEETGERVVQHYISLYNKKFDDKTDFVVLDIEYAISANAEYAKEEEREKQPRIDIVAIEKDTGLIWVMELKYGMKSVDNDSGVDKHHKDYLATVGNDNKWRSFVRDIKTLLEAKQDDELKLISKDIHIKEAKPRFAFIMKQELESDEVKFSEYLKENKLSDIQTIYLPVGKDYSNPSDLGYKLSKENLR